MDTETDITKKTTISKNSLLSLFFGLAGGFDENIKGDGEDLDLIERIKSNGWLLSSNEKARFLHNFRENLIDFWKEQNWFGYGEHFFKIYSQAISRYLFWQGLDK